MNPYIDDDGIRTFSADTDSRELVWHRDREDRVITVLEGDGWGFQHDDGLPITLYKGDEIEIPKMRYHRILLGNNPLKLRVHKLV